jgi:peptidoglycan L-alanyl-D-glutamate endopeptidase CwlK
MAYKLGKRSLQRLEGVHPDLAAVVHMAIGFTKQDFSVLEGMRTIEQQRINIAKGVSWTMNSRHLTGHAVDLGAYLGGTIRWEDPLYILIADAMKKAAEVLDVDVEWGQDLWGKDGAHFQLSWDRYPK